MSVKSIVRHLVRNYNPISFTVLRKMRREIRNISVSLLCPDCMGGILFHDLGMQFRSPTVNLMLNQRDFVKFVLRVDHYLEQEFHFFKHPIHNCPCAVLDDITVHFTHYSDPDQAVQKWRERAERLDRNNLFVVLLERDGLTREDILALRDLPVRGLLVFTRKDYPDIPYALKCPILDENGEVGNLLAISPWDGLRGYERYFDFVKWFNESNGENGFDITPYRK